MEGGTSTDPIRALAASIISSPSGWELTEEACNLFLAEMRFLRRVVSRKGFGNPNPFSEEELFQVLDAGERIHADAWRAWEEFTSHEWPLPLGRVPPERAHEWTRASERLLGSLREVRLRLDHLERAQGRSGQHSLHP
jgi:hypothetical protein